MQTNYPSLPQGISALKAWKELMKQENREQLKDIVCQIKYPCIRCGTRLDVSDVYTVGEEDYCEHCHDDLLIEQRGATKSGN